MNSEDLPADWIAIKIESAILGKTIWLARKKTFVAPDDDVVYHLDEIEELKDKSPDEIRSIQAAKEVFKGAKIIRRNGRLHRVK